MDLVLSAYSLHPLDPVAKMAHDGVGSHQIIWDSMITPPPHGTCFIVDHQGGRLMLVTLQAQLLRGQLRPIKAQKVPELERRKAGIANVFAPRPEVPRGSGKCVGGKSIRAKVSPCSFGKREG